MSLVSQIKCKLPWMNYWMFFSTFAIFALQICRTYCDSVYKKGHIYTLNAVDIKGRSIPLSTYRGKVLLIVNVATYCGFTQSHYKDLVEVQKRFGPKKLTVMAFPCNQFGEQEPDTNEEIIEFLKQMYKVNFPVFSKTEVVGRDAHPIFKFLEDQTGKKPTWNFWKYLVDHKGNVLNAWSPATSVEALAGEIESAVNRIPSYADEL